MSLETLERPTESSASLDIPVEIEQSPERPSRVSRAREIINYLKEKYNGLKNKFNAKEVGEVTAEYLDSVVGESFGSEEEAKAERLDAVVAVEIISVDSGLSEGAIENDPIAQALNSGHEDLLIEGVKEIASSEIETAEKVADDIDKREKELEEAYESKLDRLQLEKKLTTSEIFMKVETSGMSKKEANAARDNPENWDIERREVQEQIFQQRLSESSALSERLRQHRGYPVILALRGSPGAGKTTSLRRGHELFKGILDDAGKPTGAVAPDVFKGPLKGGLEISSEQVHTESTMLGRRLRRELMSDPEASLVYDKLMNEVGDIAEMVADARESGKKLGMLDIDVPLELSAIRVLCRKKGGEDPNIAFLGVAEGFRGIRDNRGNAIRAFESAGVEFVDGYLLMVFDVETRQSVEMAKWETDEHGAGRVVPLPGMEQKFEHFMSKSEDERKVLTQAEIDLVSETLIDDNFIERFIGVYFDLSTEGGRSAAESTRRELEANKGKTIKQALDEKSL